MAEQFTMPTRGSKRRRPVATLDRRRFDHVTATISEKTDIRTVLRSLQAVDNDYSDNARPFRAGNVAFIDLIGPRGARLKQNSRYLQDRQSVFEQLLHEPNASSCSAPQ